MNGKDFERIVSEAASAAERALAAGLRVLAEEDQSKEAPERLEPALLQAFRRQASTSPAPARRPRWAFGFGLASVAAAILIVAAVAPGMLRRRPPPRRDTSIVARQPLPVPPVQTAQPSDPPSRPTHRKVSTAPARQAAARAQKEVATEFLPLTYGDNLIPLEGGQVVRIRLPRSALTSFGLPVNEERAGEHIKADVLLGQDGVARAIRFVR